jgi:hypothetical protein
MKCSRAAKSSLGSSESSLRLLWRLNLSRQELERSDTVKYVLLMNTMRAGGGGFPGWSQKDIQNHVAFMMRLNRGLIESGELVGAEGLTFPDQARLVRAGNDGVPITDGVFPESKEFLAGFWIVEVASAQRAYEIAGRASAAPGAGGVPLNMPIEVRQVTSVNLG